MPGYTHLQRGRPILLGHHLFGPRLGLFRATANVSTTPCAGSTARRSALRHGRHPHPIDRLRTADILGFGGVVENAMDAVAARDHEQEVAAAARSPCVQVSRLAEELVIWSSSEFRFVRLGRGLRDRFLDHARRSATPTPPSSCAANRRGWWARSRASCLLTKGTPLSYNRDFQEDRGLLFDAVETTCDSLHLLAGVIGSAEFAARRFEEELAWDTSLAHRAGRPVGRAWRSLPRSPRSGRPAGPLPRRKRPRPAARSPPRSPRISTPGWPATSPRCSTRGGRPSGAPRRRHRARRNRPPAGPPALRARALSRPVRAPRIGRSSIDRASFLW